MAMVTFSQGLYSDYLDILVKDPHQIYFCTDTNQIFVGQVEYTAGIKQLSTLPENGGGLYSAGTIVQYVGTTTSDYINGCFYKLSSEGTWDKLDTQPEDKPINITYADYQQLSPEEIASHTYLIVDYPGSTIEVDAQDVSYRTSTVYAALNLLFGNLAPYETTSVASQAYAIDNYLVNSNGQFCRVTEAISQGDTITVGAEGNCVVTTVGYELAHAHVNFTVV